MAVLFKLREGGVYPSINDRARCAPGPPSENGSGLRRQEPRIPVSTVGTSVFFAGLLRIRSFNALEPMLAEPTFIRLVGGAPPEAEDLGSADTLSRSLRSFELERARALTVGMVQQAERNKVFREGWVGAQRYVALDGWEPIQSLSRHCAHCLVRSLKVKQRDGTWREVRQYYHRFVVAMLIDERFDLALDFEPLLPADLRPPRTCKNREDEGELTAARRLLRRVKQTYGWLDVVVADGLYPNGPFLTDARPADGRRDRAPEGDGRTAQGGTFDLGHRQGSTGHRE